MSSNEQDADSCDKNESNKNSPAVSQTEDDADFFGPALPPKFMEKHSSQSNKCEKIYGPILPSYISQAEKLQSNNSTLAASKSGDAVLIGPGLPEHSKSTISKASEETESRVSGVGDTHEQGDEDDDDHFGPSTTLMAKGDVASYSSYKNVINQHNKDASEESVKRESWMTELPEKKSASFGLFPRHFKTRIQTDNESDATVWTDTPANKERKKNEDKKKDHKEILKLKRLKERDKEMEKLAKKAAKKLRKKESLLEMHMKNRKKKEKKEAKKKEKKGKTVPERRPFDRNVDLQIRNFDESQRRAILNKSQFLNDRFASGESKFL